MTRKQALKIVEDLANASWVTNEQTMGRVIVEALDRAGAFPSEETEAEIADVASKILRVDDRSTFYLADLALRLASACRAMGLVKS